MTVASIDAYTAGLFLIMISLTLGITYWASKHTKNTEDFYTAGRGITAFQNGLALVGDFVSASSFLGFTGLIALNGFDGLIYSTSGLMGWPLLLFLVAEPMRNLGRFTLADALITRFMTVPIKAAASLSSLSIILFYLIAQMLGAGYLIQLIFGMPYVAAEFLVGAAMIVYVLFGGMLATTWVQIIKAMLLVSGGIILSFLVLKQVDFNPLELIHQAVNMAGESILSPGKLYANSWDAISLAMAFTFGTLGLPHILMRFFTVPDARSARTSVVYATFIIGGFYLLTFILGLGAMVYVGRDVILSFDKGGNMAALLLAKNLGGPGLLGFIAAVAFATILAVVAGLTLSGATSIAHDLWAGVIKKDIISPSSEMRIARIATISIGLIAILAGIVFKGQNVAVMVGLAFSIAASGNFPAIMLSLFWKRATTAGIITSMIGGTFSSIILIGLSPTVMIDVFHMDYCIFPFKNPGLFTIPLSFLAGIGVSFITKDPAAHKAYAGLHDAMYGGSK